MKKLVLSIIFVLSCTLYLGAVGQRSVVLTWTEVTSSVTFNVYRGAVTGVCSGTPTPYATGVTATTFTDLSVTAGQTYFYAVSAVKGVESTCSNEVQIAVPSAPATPQSLQGTTT
jgi:fibronectin type 3 domain-containing protein